MASLPEAEVMPPNAGTLALTGPVTLATLAHSRAMLDSAPASIATDQSGVTVLDTAGAWLIASYRACLAPGGQALTVTGAIPAQAQLIKTVTEVPPPGRTAKNRRPQDDAADALSFVRAAVSKVG